MRYKLGRCRIPEHLENARMSVQDLVDKTGYTKQEISNWSNKIRKNMELPTAISIAEALGCSERDLYELIAIEPTEPRS